MNKTIICEYIADYGFWTISVDGHILYECVATDEVSGIINELVR